MAAIIMVILFFVSIFDSLVLGNAAKKSLPDKEITRGEFPFEIVYSIDGEVFEKRGVIICECSKDYETGYGAYWDFERYFDEFSDDNVLCTEPYEIKIDCGNARYYLDGKKPYENYVPGEYIYYVWMGQSHEFTYEQAKKLFGIEIISTKFSEPLVNLEDEKHK